ncbi:hypothetical protein Barb6XT_01384 [Bacteroidales bacterium Barb6XT]|nr:hypothetical protein Barb6XT_01384 [Bacteroidales bacterium Barb6XT]
MNIMNMDFPTQFMVILSIVLFGVCIFVHTPPGKRWTGETDDSAE